MAAFASELFETAAAADAWAERQCRLAAALRLFPRDFGNRPVLIVPVVNGKHGGCLDVDLEPLETLDGRLEREFADAREGWGLRLDWLRPVTTGYRRSLYFER